MQFIIQLLWRTNTIHIPMYIIIIVCMCVCQKTCQFGLCPLSTTLLQRPQWLVSLSCFVSLSGENGGGTRIEHVDGVIESEIEYAKRKKRKKKQNHQVLFSVCVHPQHTSTSPPPKPLETSITREFSQRLHCRVKKLTSVSNPIYKPSITNYQQGQQLSNYSPLTSFQQVCTG